MVWLTTLQMIPEPLQARLGALKSRLRPDFAPTVPKESLGRQPMPSRPVLGSPQNAVFSLVHLPGFVPLALILVATSLALWRLDAVPPLWWDEGWTLCDARSWVELGHYGCLLAGEPAPSTLSAAFPVVAPIALSFRLFGVGIWQARIVGVLFTAGTLAIIYYLAAKLYNRSVAIATLVILLLVPYDRLHPVFMGKQVLGEMPALFFLLAGYTLFLWTLHKSLWFLPLALGFWGLALMTKAQVLPFWTLSLLLPLGVALTRRRWRATVLLAVGWIGSHGAILVLLRGKQFLLPEQSLGRAPVTGLVEALAQVPLAPSRLITLGFVLLYGTMILLGLGYALWKWLRNCRISDPNDAPELIRLMLLMLAGSWFGWYAFFSIGWIRYLFPVAFLSSPFIASLLYDLTGGFRFPSLLKEVAWALKTRRLRPHARAIGAYFLIMILAFHTVEALSFYASYLRAGDTSVLDVTRFLNTATPPNTLIETYESELFVFLDRPYHYPPAQVNAELIRRDDLDQDVLIDYDPLAADPDYLVVRRHRGPHLYDPILATDAFRPLQTFGLYEVYERVR